MEISIVSALIDLFSLELSAFLKVSYHKLDQVRIHQIFRELGLHPIDKKSFRNLFAIANHCQLAFIFKFFDCQSTEKLTIDSVIRTIGCEAQGECPPKSKSIEYFVNILKALKLQYQQIKTIWEAKSIKLKTIKNVLCQIYRKFGKTAITYQDFMNLCENLAIRICLDLQCYLQSSVFKSQSTSVQDLLSHVVKYYDYADYSDPQIQSDQRNQSHEIDTIIRRYLDSENQPYSSKSRQETEAEQLPPNLVLPINNSSAYLRSKYDSEYQKLIAEHSFSKPKISHQCILSMINQPDDLIYHKSQRHEFSKNNPGTFACLFIPSKQPPLADIIKNSNQKIKKIQRRALENAYRKMGYLL